MISMLRRRATRGVAGLVAAASLLAANAATTQASVIHPDSEGCSGNICIWVSGHAGSAVSIEGWANGGGFYGTILLTGPSGLTEKVGPTTFAGHGGTTAFFYVPNAKPKTYCVMGTDGDTGAAEGRACENVS